MQKIKVFSQVVPFSEELSNYKSAGKSIGFVPTMGALHAGHISLVKKAKVHSDIVIVSIFVNPTQFSNSDDLKKYPRTIDEDILLLEKAGVDIVFTPSVEEMYPKNTKQEKINLGKMDKVMEGRFRPGHFDGVVQVVKRLFDIVEPNAACFGKKDFQQLAVIQYMTDYYKLPIQIIGCEIIREKSGLAMSSRNMRLSVKQKKDSLAIFETLKFAKENASNYSPKELKSLSKTYFKKSNLKLEYLEIIHPVSLIVLNSDWVEGAKCCIACYCGEIRLIDNIQLTPIILKS